MITTVNYLSLLAPGAGSYDKLPLFSVEQN